jgi:hypothetical protein
LGTVAATKSATLWDALTGRKLAVLADSDVDDLAFSKDGRRLSVRSTNSRGSLWDSEHARKVTDFHAIGEDYEGTFSDDGSRYATSARSNFGALWDTSTGRMLARLGGEGATYDVKLSADGRRLAMQTDGRGLVVFDTSDVPVEESGSALRERACRINKRVIGIFSAGQRDRLPTRNSDYTPYLRGRPWHPCDWQGLSTGEGWLQAVRYWLVKLGIPWDYRCGEKTIGSPDPETLELCKAIKDIESKPPARSQVRTESAPRKN